MEISQHTKSLNLCGYTRKLIAIKTTKDDSIMDEVTRNEIRRKQIEGMRNASNSQFDEGYQQAIQNFYSNIPTQEQFIPEREEKPLDWIDMFILVVWTFVQSMVNKLRGK